MSNKMHTKDDTQSSLSGTSANTVPGIRNYDSTGKDIVEDVPGLSLRTIKKILNGKVQSVEAKIVTSIQRMASLNHLSSFLDLRGRLQELGAIFSPTSELVAYGSPASKQEFQEMLALGPMYEEQWNMFFVEYRSAETQGAADMWPDLRTLKKILSNNGVVFGIEHVRLSCGDSSDGMLRLCEAYDELRREWLAMMQLRLPEDDDEELQDFDNSCSEDSFGSEEGSESALKPVVLHERADSGFHNRVHLPRSSGIPRNLGWRFSDDIEVKATDIERNLKGTKELLTMNVGKAMASTPKAAAEVNSCSMATDEAFKLQLRLAVGISLPISRPGTPAYSSNKPVTLQGSALRQGFSSKQLSPCSQRLTLVEALSITPPRYEMKMQPDTTDVNIDRPIAFYRMQQKQEKPKQGPWTWLQRVFCLGG